MLFAQISDAHIMGPGEKPFGLAPVEENLARAIAQINGLEPRPDLVLVTGDITSHGAEENARQAARLLSELDMPWYVIPGNHDSREALRAAFGRENLPAGDGPFLQYAFTHAGVRFIALDTSEPGRPGGVLCPERLKWLEETLAQDRDAPTILFMHHPPVKFGILETDEDGFEGVPELGEIAARHGNVRHILCGHTHLSLFALWQGALVSTAPAVSGMRLAVDLTMKKPSAFHLDDAAWHLHRWTDGGLQTIGMSARDFETTHLF
jgi:3',5'-cyclic AMP phosphodiesterase CpdA